MTIAILDGDAIKYSRALDESFPFFWREICVLRIGAEPTRTQLEIAEWLQNGPGDRGILGYRELSKTWELVAYVLWRLRRDPNRIKSKLVSETEGHSAKSLVLAREWVNKVAFLQRLAPPTDRGSLHRANTTEFDVGPCSVEPAPSINAIGITGQTTGGRANLLVYDDCETDENTMTAHQRDLLKQRMKELEFLGRDGDRIAIGTYHHEDSLYLHMAEKGYTFRAWPARHPTEQQRAKIYFLAPQVARRLDSGEAKPGEPLDPQFASDEALARVELKVGVAKSDQQLMLIPAAADSNAYPLKQRDLIVFTSGRDKAPASIVWGTHTSRGSTQCEDIPVVGFTGDGLYRPIFVQDDMWLDFRGTKAFIDPAGDGADELAWAIVGQLHGYLYVKHVDAIGGEGSKTTTPNLERIGLSLREHGATEVWIESNFGGSMLGQLLRPILNRFMLRPLADTGQPDVRTNDRFPDGWACYIQTVHNSVQKEVRIIDTLEPVMSTHRLVVADGVAADHVLMKQLTRITKQRNCLEHDDRLDALAGAVAQFHDELDQDPATQARRAQQAEQERQMEQWMREVDDSSCKPRESWIHY